MRFTVFFVLMPFHPENRQLLSESTATMPANIANPNEIERDFLLFSTCARCHWMTLRILYSYKWGTRSLVRKCDVVHTFWPFLGKTGMIYRQERPRQQLTLQKNKITLKNQNFKYCLLGIIKANTAAKSDDRQLQAYGQTPYHRTRLYLYALAINVCEVLLTHEGRLINTTPVARSHLNST